MFNACPCSNWGSQSPAFSGRHKTTGHIAAAPPTLPVTRKRLGAWSSILRHSWRLSKPLDRCGISVGINHLVFGGSNFPALPEDKEAYTAQDHQHHILSHQLSL